MNAAEFPTVSYDVLLRIFTKHKETTQFDEEAKFRFWTKWMKEQGGDLPTEKALQLLDLIYLKKMGSLFIGKYMSGKAVAKLDVPKAIGDALTNKVEQGGFTQYMQVRTKRVKSELYQNRET